MRQERYSKLRAILAGLDVDRNDFAPTRHAIRVWQTEPGNIEALSEVSLEHYARFMRALERMYEQAQGDHPLTGFEGPEELLHARAAKRRFHDAARDSHAFLSLQSAEDQRQYVCSLRDNLVESLATDLAERRRQVTSEAAWLRLDPDYLPPDDPGKWQHWYERLCLQAMHEDELIHQRLTWMMQFEGFLFTAFALSFSAKTDQPLLRTVVLAVVPSVGISGAYAALRGVRAAQEVLESHKRAYLSSLQRFKNSSVRPFSKIMPKLVSSMFPNIIVAAWSLILVGVLVSAFFGGRR